MARFGVKEVADCTFYNLLTGKPDLYLDTLKMSNLENASENVSANGGKGSPQLVSWDFGRTANFNIQDALLNPKAISMQAGTELVKKTEKIYKRELLETSAVGVTTSKKPLAGTVTVYTTDAQGYEHISEVAVGSITGKDITFAVEDEDDNPITLPPLGTKVLVYYQYQTTSEAEIITIKSDKFGGYYRVVGDTLWRNEATGNDEMVQIVIPKAKISSAFTLTMQPDGEPSVFDFNLSVMKAPDSTDMVKLVRYSDSDDE